MDGGSWRGVFQTAAGLGFKSDRFRREMKVGLGAQYGGNVMPRRDEGL